MERSRSSRVRALRQMQSYLAEGEEAPVDIVYYSLKDRKWYIENIMLRYNSIEAVGQARITSGVWWGSAYDFDTIPLVRSILKARAEYRKAESIVTIRRVRGLPFGGASLAAAFGAPNEPLTIALPHRQAA